MDRQRDRIRYGVVDMNQFDRHAAKLDLAARMDDVQLRLIGQPVLLELAFDKAEGQRSAVNGQIYLFQQIGHRADMVFVAVGQHDPADFIGIAFHKSEIGQNQIDTEHIPVRESHAAVDDHHIVFTFKQCKILSDLV